MADGKGIYKLGYARYNHLVIYEDGGYKESVSVKTSDGGVSTKFNDVPRDKLLSSGYMQSLTSTGVKLLSSKVLDGKCVSKGCDLADDWIKQNGGIVPFDSKQFAVVRSPDSVSSVSEMRYIGAEDVHVIVPDGVCHADRMFKDREIASCKLPKSVQTAYDIGGSSNPDLIVGLPWSKTPLYHNAGEFNTSGWSAPADTKILGYGNEYDKNNKRTEYPVVFYKNNTSICKYSPATGSISFSESSAAAADMLKYDNFNFTAEGIRTVTHCDIKAYSDKRSITEHINIAAKQEEM